MAVNDAVKMIHSRFAQKEGSDCYRIQNSANFNRLETPCQQHFYFGKMVDENELVHIECGRYTKKMYQTNDARKICFVCASIYDKTLLDDKKRMNELTVMFQCPAHSCDHSLSFREFAQKVCCQKARYTND